jgi:hypothetical protein
MASLAPSFGNQLRVGELVEHISFFLALSTRMTQQAQLFQIAG